MGLQKTFVLQRESYYIAGVDKQIIIRCIADAGGDSGRGAFLVCGIYVICNRLNNKIYLGSSIDLRRRLLEHLRQLRKGEHHSPKLQRAWFKYGEHSFELRVVELVKNPAEILSREQWWLDRLQPWDSNVGYNICKQGRNWFGNKHTPETKLKIGMAHKGKTVSNETRRKISEANRGNQTWLGRHHSEDTKKKISAQHKGRTFTPEQHTRVVKANRRTHKGNPKSLETRRKISLAKMGHPVSIETKERLKLAWVKRKAKKMA